MPVVVPRSARFRRARGLAGVVAALAVVVLGAAACTGSTTNGNAASPVARSSADTGQQSSAPSTSAAPDAVISTNPTATSNVNPAIPITVSIAEGTLTSVTLLNPDGRSVRGALDSGGTSWKNTEELGYNKTYRLTASGMSTSGKAVSKTTTFTTVSPNNLTMPYMQYPGGYALSNGATYGVGLVPVVHFDEQITNKAAAEKALIVTTTPHVDGVWNWVDSQNVHFRPKAFWPSGTKVTITAKVYGLKVGPGLYGQSDTSVSFTIGRRQLTIAYDTAPKSVNKVRVYNAAGQVIRTMNTSMGEHSGEEVNGNWINFYTLNGTYTVLGHEQPAKMCSASYGLPANAPGGYPCENIYNATKISTDGIYLHYLPTTIWAQDNGQDVSHGCLNLNSDNSLWFFNHSIVGDPVVVHGAKGAPNLQLDEGGDWSVPWTTWVKGSAL